MTYCIETPTFRGMYIEYFFFRGSSNFGKVREPQGICFSSGTTKHQLRGGGLNNDILHIGFLETNPPGVVEGGDTHLSGLGQIDILVLDGFVTTCITEFCIF